MAQPFNELPGELRGELRERLLQAGVAPRHVRRYLAELADHLTDLRAEEERAGRSPADAESAALIRLGGMEELARAMTEKRQLQSWCVRAPWAIFGLAPLGLLAGAWLAAFFILWSGWKMFLPGADTPFVPVDGFANLYFQAGRALYFAAPILIGWGIGLVAARQRLKAFWPIASVVPIALILVTSQVRASRSEVSGGIGHISLKFAFGASAQSLPVGLYHTLVVLSLMVLVMALPYLVWRLQRAFSR
jgi:hypothetical protein